MKFVYFFSSLYLFYHVQLQKKLSPYFELVQILINELPEYNKTRGGHHFEGLNIKIELVIEQIKQTMNETIVFSDATVFVNERTCKNLPSFLLSYAKYDLVFIKEPIPETVDSFNLNIGMMQIKSSPQTLIFFEDVLKEMQSGKAIFNHDQYIVNRFLPNYNLTYSTFEESFIYCNMYNVSNTGFIVYKSFIASGGGDRLYHYNQRIQLYRDNFLIDNETYNTWFITAKSQNKSTAGSQVLKHTTVTQKTDKQTNKQARKTKKSGWFGRD